MALPQRVKDRLYVVHTQKLPEGCELRVAPTGTAGTIRLDEKEPSSVRRKTGLPSTLLEGMSYEDEAMFSMWMSNEYDTYSDAALNFSMIHLMDNSQTKMAPRSSLAGIECRNPPKVALRPTSSTDAWFLLNLLSAVPFLSGLSYTATMEVLDASRVDAYSKDDIVVPAARRSAVLCVIWEGTCMEQQKIEHDDIDDDSYKAVWHAGDWTGPISLQPEKSLSGESDLSSTHDIVAMSSQGGESYNSRFRESTFNFKKRIGTLPNLSRKKSTKKYCRHAIVSSKYTIRASVC